MMVVTTFIQIKTPFRCKRNRFIRFFNYIERRELTEFVLRTEYLGILILLLAKVLGIFL